MLGNTQGFVINAGYRVANLAKAKAHWVNRDTIAWPGADQNGAYRLYHSSHGGIRVEATTGVQGGAFIPLTPNPDGLQPSVVEQFPHLKGATAFQVSPDSFAQIPRLLKGQLVLVQLEGNQPIAATSLQNHYSREVL